MSGGEAFAELGPTGPSLSAMHRMANEAHQLVQILMHTTVAGPNGDPARATMTLGKLRALFGGAAGETS